ncbi:MAG: dihydrodipicolinate synthase family protein, partial [Candidatus Paceibacterota bacterium]
MLTPFNQNGSIDYDLLRQLTEFYIDSGSAGLFVNCLSSEMYHLSPEERLSLTRSVVEIADGQIPVVSTGTFGGDIDTQAEYMKKVCSTCVSAVIVFTSNITRRAESDDTVLSRLQSLAQKVEDIPLG